MASEHSPETALHRRKLIKEMVVREGITNRAEIVRILKEKHGLVVSRQTVYQDFKKIALLSPGEIKEFDLDAIGTIKRNIRELDILIMNSVGKNKVMYMKHQTQQIESLHRVHNAIASRGVVDDKVEKARKKKDGEVSRIVFS